jgi:acetyl esterase/lipase
MKLLSDLVYCPDHPLQKLDLWLPDGHGQFPVVLAFHGGGWRNGDKRGTLNGYAELLGQLGVAVVSANYRLSGTHAFPAQEHDVFAALKWIGDNARAYSLDPTRVGLAGVSAGAHLAALLGVKATKQRRADNPCALRCMLLVCGVYDIGQWMMDCPHYRDLVDAFLGGPMPVKGDVAQSASPINFVHSDAPVCLCIHGENDPVVPPNQSSRFVTALRESGACAAVVTVPHLGHTAYMSGDDTTQPLGGRDTFLGFFGRHLLE